MKSDDRYKGVKFFSPHSNGNGRESHRKYKRLDHPAVSIISSRNFRRAMFNCHATDMIRKGRYRSCSVGKLFTGETVFHFHRKRSDGYKISFPKQGQALVVCSKVHKKPHAAVPVAIDGDYFIAKFD